MEAIASGLEAIALRLEAVLLRSPLKMQPRKTEESIETNSDSWRFSLSRLPAYKPRGEVLNCGCELNVFWLSLRLDKG